METHLSDQAVAFLWSVALGAGLGAVYDWFRIGRILWKKRTLTVFFEDLLFALCAGFATSYCLVQTNYGQVRMFLLAGEAFGFILYFNTIGVFVAWQARLLRRFLHLICMLLKRLGGRFWLFIRKIVKFFKKPFLFFAYRCRIILNQPWRRKQQLEKQGRRKRGKGKKGKENEPRG